MVLNSALARKPSIMPVTLIYITVKPDRIDDFIAASKANHDASIIEAGNHRFDFLQNQADPCRFVFYEWFASDADVDLHKQTEQYKAWSQTVEAMMAEPRRSVRHNGLFPELNS